MKKMGLSMSIILSCAYIVCAAGGCIGTASLNQPPDVGDIPDQTIDDGSSFTPIQLDNYVVDPNNPDSELTWTYSGNGELVVGMVNRVATITPPNQDWNGSATIEFRATDPGGKWDRDTARFVVNPVNDPPVIQEVPEQTIEEGQLLVFYVTAKDVDGDRLFFSATNLPQGATFSQEGRFEWQTGSSQAGIYNIVITVTDGSLTDSTDLNINVSDASDITGPIIIKDGYFWDDDAGKYWIPRGIAYQTWNRPLGMWQTNEQIEYDLKEMEKAHVNSLRVDFVWKHIHRLRNTNGTDWEDWAGDGNWANMSLAEKQEWKKNNGWSTWQEFNANLSSNGWEIYYDWDRYDYLLERALAHGIRVFPLVGYQWPPDWFPLEGYTMHPPSEKYPEGPWMSDIIRYENATAQGYYVQFLQETGRRYSPGGNREDLANAIVGWILGNEYGYLGLWSIEYDGYDPDCQNAFRQWLSNRYGNISTLNTKWSRDNQNTPGYLPNYPYSSFDNVDMPIPFGYQGDTKGKYLARDKASWYDLVQWREESIARFIALGARAIKDVDSYHLRSYGAVGMQWGEEDWRYHNEDAGKIVKACQDIGAPLHFWSINNYPWGLKNHELMTGQWGIARARHDTNLPVLVTETGFTSSETMYSGMDEHRQAGLLENAIWEALETGSIGVHVFHWMDRTYITDREKGFGIVYADRHTKPGFWIVRDTYNFMEQININELFGGSVDPDSDIAFLWEDTTDSIVNRYEAEMNALFGTLERLGYEPTFINKDEFINLVDNRQTGTIKAIVLPRNQKISEEVFNRLDDLVNLGIKLHANADLPGIMDEYSIPRHTQGQTDTWTSMMDTLFGINVVNSAIDPDLEDTNYIDGYETSSFSITYKTKGLSFPYISYSGTVGMWKYSDQIPITNGTILATFDNGKPALVMKNRNTAISLFSLGDDNPDTWSWSDRYKWMKVIYRDSSKGFGLIPVLETSGSNIVLPDYRICKDGSILVSLRKYDPGVDASVTLKSGLFNSKTIESISDGIVLEENSDGIFSINMPKDATTDYSEHRLVRAYSGSPQPNIRILDAPAVVHPEDRSSLIKIRYDSRNSAETLKVDFINRNETVYSSTELDVSGVGTKDLYVYIPDRDLSNPDYISSLDGGEYYFKAYFTDDPSTASYYKTELYWGIAPVDANSIPVGSLQSGESYDLTFKWEKLPGYLWWENTPLVREEVFPGRVMVYRSTKSNNGQGNDDAITSVKVWLDSLGYHEDSLGVNEAPKGYYVIDDTLEDKNHKLVNLDPGFLREFFTLIILPDVDTMNDEEVQNLKDYINGGNYGVIGIGKGALNLADLFGVSRNISNNAGVEDLTVTDTAHYITHEYKIGDKYLVYTTSDPWTGVTYGIVPAYLKNNYPGIITNYWGEGRTLVFNFSAESLVDNPLVTRGWEWITRELYEIRLELKDENGSNIGVKKDIWITDLDGTGEDTFSLEIPSSVRSGDNMYWTSFIYPGNRANVIPWDERKGFYTSENDEIDRVSIDGIDLILEGDLYDSSGNHYALSSFPAGKELQCNFRITWAGLNRLNPAYEYKLFIILLETDTGNYWSASWDVNKGQEWQGNYSNVLTTDSGVWDLSKKLIPYDYNNFIWLVQIRNIDIADPNGQPKVEVETKVPATKM